MSTSSPACSRDRVTTIFLPKSGRSSNQRRCWRSAHDTSDDENRRLRAQVLHLGELLQRAVGRALRRERAVVDDRRRFVRVEAVREQRFQDLVKLPRSGVADERAAEPREARPVDVGRRAAFVFVPAHERHAVAAAWIGQRHAGIARRADRGRNAGHDLERDAVLVQEQRFLAAAIEQERIAPLEPRDDLSLARFFHEQVVDRFLVERLRRRRARGRSSRRPAADSAAAAGARDGRTARRRRQRDSGRRAR